MINDPNLVHIFSAAPDEYGHLDPVEKFAVTLVMEVPMLVANVM